MSLDLRFASYLRQGMADLVGNQAGVDGVPIADSDAVKIEIQTGSTLIEREFPMIGPGMITGLAAGEVLRSEPPDGAIDHPPNLFPMVELKSADLPWRYTPAQPHGENLMPWLVLLVLPERPGITLTESQPLAVLAVDDAAELPNLSEAFAWSHIQVGSSDDDLARVLAETPEAIWARLLCPRWLDPDTAYLACLVPSFEAGRLSGLGLASAGTSLTALAWTDNSSAVDLPVYHHWRFRTSPEAADFEELVRRLMPIELSPSVGVHGLDLSDPGSSRLPADEVVVGFKGALVSPELSEPRWPAAHRRRFLEGLGELLAAATPGDPIGPSEAYDPLRHDPVIAPPSYGLLPSGLDDVPPPGKRASRLAPRWLSEANLDPRHRAVAGLGAQVVRRGQERLMAKAWDQAIGIQRVNRLLTQTRLALEVGKRRQARAAALVDATLAQMSTGAHARLRWASGETAKGHVVQSDLPNGTFSAAFRRQTRAGAGLAKAIRPKATPANGSVEATGRLTRRIAENPEAMRSYADLTIPFGCTLNTGDVVGEDGDFLEGISIGTVETVDFDQWFVTHGARLNQRLNRARSGAAARLRARFAVSPAVQPIIRSVATPALSLAIDDPVATANSLLSQGQNTFQSKSVTSVFGSINHILSSAGTVSTTSAAFDLAGFAATIVGQLEPTAVLAARLRHVIQPASSLGDEPVPAAIDPAPLIDDPLYKDVVRIDPELLMPGASDLPDDSVGLAAVNAAYVEAFLLGANHEFARELLWREYPTELGGTWLRQFWDQAAAGNSASGDIDAVSSWRPTPLGSHPAGDADPTKTLVLVVKGELLYRYPNTLISAVPARWRTEDGITLREENPDGEALFPIFEGKLGRNIAFLGFQFPEALDRERDVKGSPEPDDGHPGWYIAFEQPPTEPAFGLDSEASDESPDLAFWKDLTWGDVRVSDAVPYVQLDALSVNLPYDRLGANQWSETWAESAAAMARITLQRPVRMLVHADEMLGTMSAP